MPGWRHHILPIVKRFAADSRGNFLMITAIALPALVMGALGAVDLSSVINDRVKMQAVADFAALNAAKQLALDTSDATATRAKSMAEEQLSQVATRWSLTYDAQVIEDGKAVQVTVTGKRPSYFHDMLPKGGWTSKVTAVAEIEGLTPLCVLGSGNSTDGLLGLGATPDVITMKNTAHLTASTCLVQSNNAIQVQNSSGIEAKAVQSVGDASGSIAPEPMTGAAAIKDPFDALNTTPPGLCTQLNIILLPGQPLKKGVHCGVIVVPPNTTLKLEPGEHYFTLGAFLVGGNAKLVGTDVVLIFDSLSFFSFTDQSDIELEGRKSGPFAGFVIATTKANAKTFTISTSAARKLLGVVYIPSGLLDIHGNNSVGADSAWTVIVAKTISISGGANLVVNSGYTLPNTPPVPTGVGTSGATSTVKLIK